MNHEDLYKRLEAQRLAIVAAQHLLLKEATARYTAEERGELLAKYDSMFSADMAMLRGEKP